MTQLPIRCDNHNKDEDIRLNVNSVNNPDI